MRRPLVLSAVLVAGCGTAEAPHPSGERPSPATAPFRGWKSGPPVRIRA